MAAKIGNEQTEGTPAVDLNDHFTRKFSSFRSGDWPEIADEARRLLSQSLGAEVERDSEADEIVSAACAESSENALRTVAAGLGIDYNRVSEVFETGDKKTLGEFVQCLLAETLKSGALSARASRFPQDGSEPQSFALSSVDLEGEVLIIADDSSEEQDGASVVFVSQPSAHKR